MSKEEMIRELTDNLLYYLNLKKKDRVDNYDKVYNFCKGLSNRQLENALAGEEYEDLVKEHRSLRK